MFHIKGATQNSKLIRPHDELKFFRCSNYRFTCKSILGYKKLKLDISNYEYIHFKMRKVRCSRHLARTHNTSEKKKLPRKSKRVNKKFIPAWKKRITLPLGLINYAPPHEDVWGSGDIAPPPFLTSTLDGRQWSVSCPGRFTPSTYWI
jgi:hypothetical protein